MEKPHGIHHYRRSHDIYLPDIVGDTRSLCGSLGFTERRDQFPISVFAETSVERSAGFVFASFCNRPAVEKVLSAFPPEADASSVEASAPLHSDFGLLCKRESVFYIDA